MTSVISLHTDIGMQTSQLDLYDGSVASISGIFKGVECRDAILENFLPVSGIVSLLVTEWLGGLLRTACDFWGVLGQQGRDIELHGAPGCCSELIEVPCSTGIRG